MTPFLFSNGNNHRHHLHNHHHPQPTFLCLGLPRYVSDRWLLCWYTSRQPWEKRKIQNCLRCQLLKRANPTPSLVVPRVASRRGLWDKPGCCSCKTFLWRGLSSFKNIPIIVVSVFFYINIFDHLINFKDPKNSLNSSPWSELDAWLCIVVDVLIDGLGHPCNQGIWEIPEKYLSCVLR